MRIRKTLTALAVFSMMMGSALAQKAKVVSAYNYNKSYERDKDCGELKKGIDAIEPATKDPKTSLYAKTWYYGGNLWFNAAFAKEDCAAQFDNALEKCFNYYLNALKYDIEDAAANNIDVSTKEGRANLAKYTADRATKYTDPTYPRDILNNRFPFLANAFVNKGVEEFQAKNYEKALAYSKKSIATNQFLKKVDSLGMYNAALAAERLGNTEEAISFYSQLTDIKYGGSAIYLYMASIYDKQKDTVKKMEVIRKGLESYPEDANLIREELSYLLVTGQTDQAVKKFDVAIQKDPKNPSLYYNRGLINEDLGLPEKAEADYQKALEVDPTFFDAAYNLGAMHYNKGVEWNNTASGYGLKENDKYEAATAKANASFAKALPALEKAHAINPEDRSTMESLKSIYAIVGATDKYNAMKAKIEGK